MYFYLQHVALYIFSKLPSLTWYYLYAYSVTRNAQA